MRHLLLVMCVAGALLALPNSARAATCSDYSNQADAQRAADTRDADGDGIYCESLPCPCLKSGQSGNGNAPAVAPPVPASATKKRCSRYRGRVKTLTDKGPEGASSVSFAPMDSTVSALLGLQPSTPVTRDTGGLPRMAGERVTYRIPVQLRSMSLKKDRDIHLDVADPNDANKKMVVEFVHADCTAGADRGRRLMRSARKALRNACGKARKKNRKLKGTATITGVAFFDFVHGKLGAPNGIELHPVLHFEPTSRCEGR